MKSFWGAFLTFTIFFNVLYDFSPLASALVIFRLLELTAREG